MTHPRKPKVILTQEPLRWLCNEAFFAVRKIFSDNPEYDAPIAFFEGLIGGYVLADLGAGFYGRSNMLNIFNLNSQENRTELESVVKGALITEGIMSAISPKRIIEFSKEH